MRMGVYQAALLSRERAWHRLVAITDVVGGQGKEHDHNPRILLFRFHK